MKTAGIILVSAISVPTLFFAIVGVWALSKVMFERISGALNLSKDARDMIGCAFWLAILGGVMGCLIAWGAA